jgi:hypothetical protein
MGGAKGKLIKNLYSRHLNKPTKKKKCTQIQKMISKSSTKLKKSMNFRIQFLGKWIYKVLKLYGKILPKFKQVS